MHWWLWLMLAMLAPPPAPQTPTGRQIRIGLARGASQVGLACPAGFDLLDPNTGSSLAAAKPGEVWTITPGETGINISAGPADHPTTLTAPGVAAQPRPSASNQNNLLVLVSGPRRARYRGRLQVLPDQGGLTVINLVAIEDYLLGVVPKEMSHTYPLEALKAQAIAARTQALVKLGRHASQGFDLCSADHCQVYGGADAERPETTRAAAETAGMVVTYQGKPADVVYSAVCGGHTEDFKQTWGGHPPPYLRAQPDCQQADPSHDLVAYLMGQPRVNCNVPGWYFKTGKFRWSRLLTRAQLEQLLRPPGELLELRALERGPSGRIHKLLVRGREGEQVIRGELKIRKALGGLNSSAFLILTYYGRDGRPELFALWGAGWGHGVGMCQLGAVGLAASGWGYRRILARYFPGTAVEKMNGT